MAGYRVHSRRLAARFADLAQQGRAAMVPFVVAGDPDPDVSRAILKGLPDAGADLIELGIPFSDPMADGPAIQASSLRALKAGITLEKTLAMAADFRQADAKTPLILMGYYNPIHAYGPELFTKAAAQAGIDAVIVVDLPPEESAVLDDNAHKAGLDVIRLTSPTSDEGRLPSIISGASGFIYHISVRGITGTKVAAQSDIEADIGRLRQHTDLPLAVGFGVREPQHASALARIADAVVVGSALVECIATASPGQQADRVFSLVTSLSQAVRMARSDTQDGAGA